MCIFVKNKLIPASTAATLPGRLNWCEHGSLAEKGTVWLIYVVESLRLQSYRLFCSWHHRGSFNAAGGFETWVHIYHANSQLSEIFPHAFFQKALLPEGRTFLLINPIELTRCRHLSLSVVGIVKTDFFSLKTVCKHRYG